MNSATPTRHFVRFGIGASALGIVLLWPELAGAQPVDAPAHRVEFTVAPSLPKCNDYDAFYGIVTNWVSIRTLDPTAPRKLVIAIKRLSDGGKQVDLSVLDPDGAKVASESHAYSPAEECFKVLYWTAFDAAKLLRATMPLEAEEESDKPEEDEATSTEPADKPCVVQEQPKVRPTSTSEAESSPRQRETVAVRSQKQLLFGTGVVLGLTRMPMMGFRVGVAGPIGPLGFEVDARAFPPIFTTEVESDLGQRVLMRSQAYTASAGLCARYVPLIGCVIATGGLSALEYEHAALTDDRFSRSGFDGLFYVGLRAGFEKRLSKRLALRLDMDAQLPIYQPQHFQLGQNPTESTLAPIVTGFISVVPSF